MNILDNFNAKINYKFEDDEIYELMQKYKDNEEAILNELNEELKEREKRGDEYEWHDVGKSNYNYIFNIFLEIIITKNMTIHIMIQITYIIIIKLDFPEVEEIIKEEEKKKM